jgi:hypothetical protein
MSLRKDYDRVIKNAVDQGWTLREGGRGRDRLVSPDGYQYVIPDNPKDPRGFKNFKAELKVAGYQEDGRYTPPLERIEEDDVEAATTSLGDALAAAKKVDENREDMTASGATRKLLRENPEKTYGVDDVYMVVKARLPSASKLAVQQSLSSMAATGEIMRVARGQYRWKHKSLLAIATSIPGEAPPTALTETGDASLDEDLAVLDEALTALSQIEGVVKRIHEKMNRIAELKRLLGGK